MLRSCIRALACLAPAIVSGALFPGPTRAQTLDLGPEELVTASSAWSLNQRPRVVFTPDGAKHLAWVAGNTFGAEGVFVVRAPSAGAAYGPPVQLSSGMNGVRTGIADGLEIDVKGTNMLVCWEGTNFANRPMLFARSTDTGATWEGEVRADPDTLEERAYTTGTLFADGRVAQVWIMYDGVTGEPAHEWRSQDALGSFSGPTNVCASAPDVPCDCCTSDPIILDDGTVLVAFRNNESNRRWIYVARSTDGGATFPYAVRVDQGGAILFACPSSPPSITADGNDVLVVWGKVGGSPQTFHTRSARSTDGGLTWAPQVTVDDSDGTTQAGYPTIARQGNLAVAVWGARDAVTNHLEAFCATSTDGGDSWGAEQMLTGDGLTAAVRHAGVAISPGGDVEICWLDERDGTEKVYRRAGTLAVTGTPVTGPDGFGMASPNPFWGETTIRFASATRADGRTVITDVTGRTIRQLAGGGEIRWDGRDGRGAAVPAGVYFARRTDGEAVIRIVRLR